MSAEYYKTTAYDYFAGIVGSLERVDSDDLLEAVDLDDDERVLQDRGGRDAAEEEIGFLGRRAAVVVEMR